MVILNEIVFHIKYEQKDSLTGYKILTQNIVKHNTNTKTKQQ